MTWTTNEMILLRSDYFFFVCWFHSVPIKIHRNVFPYQTWHSIWISVKCTVQHTHTQTQCNKTITRHKQNKTNSSMRIRIRYNGNDDGGDSSSDLHFEGFEWQLAEWFHTCMLMHTQFGLQLKKWRLHEQVFFTRFA